MYVNSDITSYGGQKSLTYGTRDTPFCILIGAEAMGSLLRTLTGLIAYEGDTTAAAGCLGLEEHGPGGIFVCTQELPS